MVNSSIPITPFMVSIVFNKPSYGITFQNEFKISFLDNAFCKNFSVERDSHFVFLF